MSAKKILLSGATGYVGGRLLHVLEQRGYAVRCFCRRPETCRSRAASQTEVVYGDVLKPESLEGVFSAIDTAYYLIHSLGEGSDFEQHEREGATNFAKAAKAAGVRRIIYLGGLGTATQLSPHLASRHRVGALLAEHGPQTIEFRASIIIGSGSLSFELIRALARRLPIMITPRWVATLGQPIAIEDVLSYLTAAIDLPEKESRIFEIGGPDRVSYGDLIREYADLQGLHRILIPVPLLTPWLSSLWLGLVTPVYARVGRKLIDGLRNETIVTDESAQQAFPVKPIGVREAMLRALAREDQEFAITRWSDAVSSGGNDRSWGGVKFNSRIVATEEAFVPVSVQDAFRPIAEIGGERGWYYADILWRMRGFLDLLVGGVGVRRGRRHPEQLLPGDALDFWRVEAIEPGRLLRLRAEMKVPGRAWLQFETNEEQNGARITQTALFDPAGLSGLLYWYFLYPIHRVIFSGMLKAIARRAVADAGKTDTVIPQTP